MVKFFLSLILVQFAEIAYAAEIKYHNFELGKVNGDIVKGRFKTNQIVKYNNVFRFDRNSVENDLDLIVIKNANLIKKGGNYIDVETSNYNDGKLITVNYPLELYCDGVKVSVNPRQEGQDVYIYLGQKYDVVELNIVNPIVIGLDKAHKGNFAANLDIEGRGR